MSIIISVGRMKNLHHKKNKKTSKKNTWQDSKICYNKSVKRWGKRNGKQKGKRHTGEFRFCLTHNSLLRSKNSWLHWMVMGNGILSPVDWMGCRNYSDCVLPSALADWKNPQLKSVDKTSVTCYTNNVKRGLTTASVRRSTNSLLRATNNEEWELVATNKNPVDSLKKS